MPMIQLRGGAYYKKSRPWGRIIITGILLLVILAIAGIAVKVGWSLTHPDRIRVSVPAMARGLKLQNVSFPSRMDKIQLKGWFVPAQGSQKTIIFVHGYRNNRLQENVPAIAAAGELVRKGYNVLLFDLRNSGESAGNLTSVGQFETRDVLGAVDYVKTRGAQGKHIGLLGFSMGGAAAIMAAVEDKQVEALVADSAFADLTTYLKENLPVWSNLPAIPFTPVIMTLIPPVTGINPAEVSPVRALSGIKIPVLFIHGKADTAVPYKNSEQLYQAAPAKGRELLLIEGADHVKSYQVRSKEYIARVSSFFDKHLAK